ncbi:unannotated protein [freshwater metagenome]|uniref:Unannotated protein n=1 Tax=freshwater metagenome TaxID=449393 RepID=A0A6J5ZTN0_9ZZZZ
MIEDGFLDSSFELELFDPVAAMHQVSHDYEFSKVLGLRSGKTISALDIQRMYIEKAQQYISSRDVVDEMTLDVMSHWTRQIDALATNKMSLINEVDWITKLAVVEGYRQRDHAQWDDPLLAAVDIQYADLRADKGLARVMQAKDRIVTMFSEDEVSQAIKYPPHDTRAYFRGMCMRTFTNEIAAASWDSVIFDLDQDLPLTRIATTDVRKGTKELTSHFFEAPTSAKNVVEAVGN